MYNEKIILTPQDILEKEFKIDARGYRPQEVDKFLDMIIKDYTEFNSSLKSLIKDNKNLQEENNRLKNEIRKLKELLDSKENTHSSQNVSNLDILRRISQLEKIVYGKSE